MVPKETCAALPIAPGVKVLPVLVGAQAGTARISASAAARGRKGGLGRMSDWLPARLTGLA